MTNVGVETCVAMTGEVGLSGVVNKIGGLEDKLRFAHSSPRISVVVIPRDNHEEAAELVRKHDLSSIQLLPVGHMLEVIHHIFLRSVTQGTPPAP
jgi:ATP-dependent Lon protease